MSSNRHITEDPSAFWDISALVPPRREAYKKPHAHDTEAVEVTAPPPTAPTGAKAPTTVMSATGTVMAGDVPLPERYVSSAAESAAREAPVPEARYTPVGSLLYEVRIFPHKNEYTYYSEFCRHAKKLAAIEGRECPHVPFFSYMPQYSQLTRPQLAFYLWWRTCFRRGTCLEADYSYLLLYLYELINLGDAITPREGQAAMLRLWLSYREKHPRLDVSVREWLVDYSLLYRLPPPDLPKDRLGELVAACRLKEFYVSAAADDVMCDAVLYFASNYDYKKSKFYRGEAVAHYDRVMRGAVMKTLAHFSEKRAENTPRVEGFSTVTRDLFAGAICAYPYKKRVEVDFASFSHTYELRYIITDVLKYTENALRAVLGVKSRLTVYEVSRELRAVLDEYLAESLPQKRTQKRTAAAPIPDYEKRYEQRSRPISPDRAAAIEAASWQTTRRLVEAFADSDMAQDNRENDENRTTVAEFSANSAAFLHENAPLQLGTACAPVADDGAAPTSDAAPFKLALGTLAEFLPLCDPANRAAQRAFAERQGKMVDAVADEINTVAGDMLGDIVLEDVGGAYAVIEDYREILQKEGILP